MIKFLIALLLFLPTTCFFGSIAYLLFVPIFIFLYRKELFNFIRRFFEKPFQSIYVRSLWLVLFLLIGIGLNAFLGSNLYYVFMSGTFLLIPLTILTAYIVADRTVYRFLLLFIAIEIVFGVLEYAVGANSLFTSLPKHKLFTTYSSLYKTRVFGLSANSSFLAQKCLLGFLMIYFVDLKLKTSQLINLFLILITGIILTFGRTVLVVIMLSLFLYLLFYLYNHFKKSDYFQINMNKVLFFNTIFFIFVILLTIPFWNKQFNRKGLAPHEIDKSQGTEVLEKAGIGNVEMAGRRELWGKAIDFIIDNPLSGNYSRRFLVDNIHIHNSFLEFLSTHGVILFTIMFVFIILNINITNFIFLGMILMYSLGQFGVFWNISFLDIVFMSMLLFSDKIINPKKYETNI